MPAATGRCPLPSIFLLLGLTLRMTKTLTRLTATSRCPTKDGTRGATVYNLSQPINEN
jgi:hypothetical protein